MKILLLIGFFTLFPLFRSVAQGHPYFYRITDEEGLPSNEVYQLLQDDFGYIWIGCDAGLFRYDGFRFHAYRNSKQTSRSMSNLLLDGKGRVWCRNFSGQFFRVSGDSLLLIHDHSLSGVNIGQYAVDRQQRLWLPVQDSMYLYSDQGEVVIKSNIKENIRIGVFAEMFYHDHQIFLADPSFGIVSFEEKDFSVKKLLSFDKKKGSYRFLFFKKKGVLHVLVEDIMELQFRIYAISNNTCTLTQELQAKNNTSRVHHVSEDAFGNLWIATLDGAFRLKAEHQTIDGHPEIFPGAKVSMVFCDKENNFWVSTLQDGLFVIPSLELLRVNGSNADLPESNFTTAEFLEDGTVLAGSGAGKLYHLHSDGKLIRELPLNANHRYYTTKRIRTIQGKTYAAHGVFTEIDGNTIKQYPAYNGRDFAIVGDTLFMVRSDNAVKIAFAEIKNKAPKFQSIFPTGGRWIDYDANSGALVFGLNNGVFFYRNGVLEELKNKGSSIHSGSGMFYEDALWIATFSEGVLCFKDKKLTKKFTKENGLNDDQVKWIRCYNGKAWVCTEGQLHVIDMTSEKVNAFPKSSGINALEINHIAVHQGKVMLATSKGLLFFPEKFLSTNPIAPNIQIRRVLHKDSLVNTSGSFELPFDNENLRIEFSAVAFRSRGQFKYAYRLLGLSDKWNYAPGKDNMVTYSSLPPGEYVFEVKAINESGTEGKLASLSFYVLKPIWEKWWFYLLASLGVIGIVILIFQSRLRYLRKKAEMENQLTASQLTALKAQMNPHFMYNALNSIQDLVIRHDVKNSNYYLGRFSSLMRKVLDASGKEEISLKNEVEILSLYLELEKLRFGDDFVYRIEVDEKIDQDEISIPPMVLQPFVENALKHGLLHKKGQKTLRIDFRISDVLECVIEDNGVGRKRAGEIRSRQQQTHQSFSTGATEKRIELLNRFYLGQYQVRVIDVHTNGHAEGTRVELSIPIRPFVNRN